MATDPVCKMEVEGEEFHSYHKGKTYFFCSMECKQEFDESPENYAEIDSSEMPA